MEGVSRQVEMGANDLHLRAVVLYHNAQVKRLWVLLSRTPLFPPVSCPNDGVSIILACGKRWVAKDPQHLVACAHKLVGLCCCNRIALLNSLYHSITLIRCCCCHHLAIVLEGQAVATRSAHRSSRPTSLRPSKSGFSHTSFPQMCFVPLGMNYPPSATPNCLLRKGKDNYRASRISCQGLSLGRLCSR